MNLKKDVAVSDSGFVFNPSTGESFSVNPIGMEIIGLLKENKSGKEITDYILNKYHTESSTADKDFMDFMDMLKHFSLAEDNE